MHSNKSAVILYFSVASTATLYYTALKKKIYMKQIKNFLSEYNFRYSVLFIVLSTELHVNTFFYVFLYFLLEIGGESVLLKNEDFAKKVKKRLIDLDQTRNWLIETVSEQTGMYLDDSYLSRILKGKRNPQKIIESIKNVLDI